MKNIKFYNINHIINANATPMVDKSKWVSWSLNLLKKGKSSRSINRIAHLITD